MKIAFRKSEFFKDILAASSIVFFILLSFIPIITAPLNKLLGDPFLKNFMSFFRNSVLHFKQFPFWNDFIGTVFFELPITSAAYPVFWIASLINKNPEMGYRFIILSHVLMWGPAFYFLMRFGLKINRLASLVASSGFVYSPLFFSGLVNGYVTENLTFPYFILSAAFFFRSYFYLHRNSWKLVFFSGFFLGLMFLAGGSFLYLYAILFYFLFFLMTVFYILIFRPSNYFFVLLKYCLYFCFAILVSVGVSAVQFFPSFLFTTYGTGRSLSSYETMIGQVIPLTFYINEFIKSYPYYLGFLFFGIFIISLFLIFFKKNKEILLLSILFILFAWITWGRAAPVDIYYLIYKYFPGFKNNHDTTRFIIFVYFLLFAISGLTLNTLFKQSTNKIFKGLLCIFPVLCLLLFSSHAKAKLSNYFQSLPESKYHPTETDLSLSKIIDENYETYPSDRFLFYHSFKPYYQIMDNKIQILPSSEALAGNTPILWLSKFYEWSTMGAEYRFQLMGLLNLRYLTSGYLSIPYPSENTKLFDLEYLKSHFVFKDGSIYENKAFLPRILFPENASLFLLSYKDFTDFNYLLSMRKIIFKEKRDFNHEIFLATTYSRSASISDEPVYKDVYISSSLKDHEGIMNRYFNGNYIKSVFSNPNFIKYESRFPLRSIDASKSPPLLISNRYFSPNKIELRVINNSSNSRFFYLGDPFYPNWKAYINGKESPVFLANGIGRGLLLPKEGEYKILFKYQIKYFKLYLIITFLFIIATLYLFGNYVYFTYTKRNNSIAVPGKGNNLLR